MCQFIETIQILDGQIQRLEYHQKRMDATRHHFFGNVAPLNLGQYLIPLPVYEEIKCRVVYDEKGLVDVGYSLYHIRHIQSLHVVTDDDIIYPYKSINRCRLADLSAQKGDCDEVLIVRKGLITDTSYTNVALYDGKQWVTPAHPLLKGTQRASLIDKGLLHEQDIRIDDLYKYQQLALINAMIDFGKVVMPISNIRY